MVLSLEDARRLIRSRVETQLVGVNATVTIGKTKFINIFVAGNVNLWGLFYASPFESNSCIIHRWWHLRSWNI